MEREVVEAVVVALDWVFYFEFSELESTDTDLDEVVSEVGSLGAELTLADEIVRNKKKAIKKIFF